jgi:hypothetical protein
MHGITALFQNAFYEGVLQFVLISWTLSPIQVLLLKCYISESKYLSTYTQRET